MRIDIRGRVDNIKLLNTKWLLPVFEAVVNSIHAIDDAKERDGQIVLTVERDQSQGLLSLANAESSPITSFSILDNGIGFTNDNFEAFCTSDTRFKAGRGGKGVGRFLWLKAFDRVRVDSAYLDAGGTRRNRSFEFTYSKQGISKHHDNPIHDDNAQTTVVLESLKKAYRDQSPKGIEGIADRLIEHCMEYLVHNTCPQLTVCDPDADREINVNARYSDVVRANAGKFEIGPHHFSINHLRVAPDAARRKHRIHLCAHNRDVCDEIISARIPNLERPLYDPSEDRQFVYAGYVSGKFLDERVNAERTGFALLSPDDLPRPDEINEEVLFEVSCEHAKKFLEPFTQSLQEEKERRVREYVCRDAPQFRPLITHKPEVLEVLPSNLSFDKLDVELYKLDQVYRAELQEKYQELLQDSETWEDFEEHREQYEEFLKEWNETGVATLAKYVAHRKATLSFLAKRLARRNDGTYHYEEAIHELVFPLRTTSDDVPSENMNLWIIDERLAYHHYLASDKYLDNLEPVQVDAHRRADIIVFGHSFAFSEGNSPNFGSITLIEFKRPARDDYSARDNPIEQILTYIEDLRSAKTKDRRGRPLQIPKTLPIHAFIVCDVTPKLEMLAKRSHFIPTVDQHRYFCYHPEYNATIEIISFDAMLDHAERRNRILFEKLGVNDAAILASNRESCV